MTAYVKINYGKWRNQPVNGTIFPVIKDWVNFSSGGAITVDGREMLNTSNKARIKCEPSDMDFSVTVDDYNEQLNMMGKGTAPKKGEPTEADDEKRIEEIAERFEIMDEMTKATIGGDIRAMIVTGPPGVGKSYGIETELEKWSLFDQISTRPARYEVVKGAMRPLGLYAKLFAYSDARDVLVFDDCDDVFKDDLALNILKAALDSGKKRVIHWNADSNMLKKEGIPNSFEYKGSVIFVTNLNFTNTTSKNLKSHLDALMSRCHFIDLTLDTMRDKILRIKQIAKTGKLFQGYKMEAEDEAEILNFMMDNKDNLREMSLRMALKMADLKKIHRRNPNTDYWKRVARGTCMKRVLS
jgi:hypothetical protein